MVSYNPKDWFKIIFQFHKSDTFRQLFPTMVGIAIYVLVLDYVEFNVTRFVSKGTTAVHSMLGFVISMLLVFRTNTAYERWWEGRKLWGAFVNNSRNLAIKLHAFVPKSDKALRKEIRIHITNYLYAAKDHLRANKTLEEIEDNEHYTAATLRNYSHIPNKVAALLLEEINDLYKAGLITGDQLIILNDELKSFTDGLGACERIKNTPIPYSYNTFIKKFIFLYVMTLPMAFIAEFGYWTIVIVLLIFYALASLELIAEEIEDPFGVDANDLPTEEIAHRIKANLIEILEE